ncbi:MAG: hypothetical protein A2Z25_03170 [Planctomycetes bacterium RBG_16_55_9]|nr:MAG: hypothetical protein A2Z25_03170 [Planctomycetes bacterium RBG_16_55_9]
MKARNTKSKVNPKFEVRNSKQIQNPNVPMIETAAPSGENRLEHSNFYHSILFRISDFVLRISAPHGFGFRI